MPASSDASLESAQSKVIQQSAQVEAVPMVCGLWLQGWSPKAWGCAPENQKPTLTKGARQLVVQEALEMMGAEGSKSPSLTPMT